MKTTTTRKAAAGATGSAADFLPATRSIPALRRAAAGWTPDARGKRRIHQKPNSAEIGACHPWLDAEINTTKPTIILALGATAAKAIFGPKTLVTKQRGRAIATTLAKAGFVTVHPSAVLRAPAEDRASAEKAFVNDLKKVARHREKLRA